MTLLKKLETCLHLHAADVYGSVTGISSLIIDIQDDEGVDVLLQKYGPDLIFAGLESIEHLVADQRIIVAGKIVVDERKTATDGGFFSFPLHRSGQIQGF